MSRCRTCCSTHERCARQWSTGCACSWSTSTGQWRRPRYATPLEVVSEVEGSFRPWNAGHYRLQADGDSVTCERTRASADLQQLSPTELGAVLLGGNDAGVASCRWSGQRAAAGCGSPLYGRLLRPAGAVLPRRRSLQRTLTVVC